MDKLTLGALEVRILRRPDGSEMWRTLQCPTTQPGGKYGHHDQFSVVRLCQGRTSPDMGSSIECATWGTCKTGCDNSVERRAATDDDLHQFFAATKWDVRYRGGPDAHEWIEAERGHLQRCGLLSSEADRMLAAAKAE